MAGDKCSPEAVARARREYFEAASEQAALEAQRHLLTLAIERISDQLLEAEHKATINGFYLQACGVNLSELNKQVQATLPDDLPQDDAVDAILGVARPQPESKRRLKGDELLDEFAREMLRRGAPMDFDDMIDFIDSVGIERPGANYRNYIISIVTRAKDRFARVGRGQYYLTIPEQVRLGRQTDEDAAS